MAVRTRGGYRVVHFFDREEGTPAFLITVFAKNEKANLTRGRRPRP